MHIIGINHYETFLLAGILLNLTPGNDTIYILSRSIAHGRNAGILSALGIGSGSVVHTMLAAFGLSIIISRSILVFSIIKYLGAIYLVYIGIKMIMDKSRLQFKADIQPAQKKSASIYRDAALTNIFNPKVAMFFIAFLPQFIEPTYKSSIIPFITLGFTFTFTGTIWCILLALFSSRIFLKLRDNRKLSFYLNKTCGAVLIGLGIKLALIDRK
jgi:RhtB (resistance to homoserine/threonine) family protein